MRADPDPGKAHAPDGMCQTPDAEPEGQARKGCTVAVLLAGDFMLVGRIERRPVPHRRLVIRCRDVRGNEGVTRIYGLRDKDTQVWRVVGVYTQVPFADADDGDPD